MVIGSEVPNLLQPGAASSLVVSQDVNIGVPISVHAAVKRKLPHVRDLRPSSDEPSVWVPTSEDLLEVNFVGIDERLQDPGDAYVHEDPDLPMLVIGALSLLRPGRIADVEGVRVPLPTPASLALEKLVTDRTSEKGDRDLLVVAGLLHVMTDDEIEELLTQCEALVPVLRHAVRSNLTILSLMPGRSGMPDPASQRARVSQFLDRLGDEP
jgi:hypothetical protein